MFLSFMKPPIDRTGAYLALPFALFKLGPMVLFVTVLKEIGWQHRFMYG
jgi:hypothetical protein